MATENKGMKVRIIAGPSTLELITSLTRKGHGPYGIDMDKGTSVHFTTADTAMSGPLKGMPLSTIPAFSAAIESMTRIVCTGDRWILKGTIFDYDDVHHFEGDYNAKTRNGHFTLT